MKPDQGESLLKTLQARFESNMPRHRGLVWTDVRARLERNPSVLKTLQAMESTGGEPDVVGYSPETRRYTFCDCSAESPIGRRSVCYDQAALKSRKEHQPLTSAVEMAATLGVDLLTIEAYRELQELGDFDTKTSSWLKTPTDIRSLGGALFGDKRYGKVFVYHNGAQSYYAVRGFRGSVLV
jgi:hypothetical protein